MHTLSIEWIEGKEAYRNGEFKNPYDRELQHHSWENWEQGWNEMREASTKTEDHLS